LLVDFEDASRLHDRRLLLALRKAHGAVAVDIDAGEPFAVMVVNSDLPVTVLASPILFQPTEFLPCWLVLFLFHVEITLEKSSDYRKFGSVAQVAS
jgi:hypothetical protein